jgi:hypothetical protein
MWDHSSTLAWPAPHLVEVQCIQQVIELAVLLILMKHHVVLHQAVKCKLALVVHIDLLGLQVHMGGGRQGEGGGPGGRTGMSYKLGCWQMD